MIARVQCHLIHCLENWELGKQSVVLHLPAVYVCRDSEPLKLDHTSKAYWDCKQSNAEWWQSSPLTFMFTCWCKHEALRSFISAENFQHKNKLLAHDYMQLSNIAKFSKQNCEKPKRDILLIYVLNCSKGTRFMFVVSSGLCLACFRWNFHRQHNPTLMINKCFDRNEISWKLQKWSINLPCENEVCIMCTCNVLQILSFIFLF